MGAVKQWIRLRRGTQVSFIVCVWAEWQRGLLSEAEISPCTLFFSISLYFPSSHTFLDCAWCNPTRPGATLAHHAALSMSQWGNYENMNFMTWNEKGHAVWIDVQRRWKWCNFLNSVIMVMCNGNAYLLSKISLSAWIVQLCAVSIFLEQTFSLVECLKSNVKYVLIHLMTADGNTWDWMVLVWYCVLFYTLWLRCVWAVCPGPMTEKSRVRSSKVACAD